MIEAVIFDMDGLLIDSEPYWRKSHVSAVAEHGVKITEDNVRQMAGKRTDEVVRHWRDTQGLTHVPNDVLVLSVVSRVIESISLNGQELPGVRKIISIIEEHSIPMAVASSSSPEIIEIVLKKLDLNKHMKLAYSAKYEKFGKPHPGVFITTAKKLAVNPANCVVFEDSLSGVRAAKSAGMKCIAIPDVENLNKPEFSYEADLVLNSLEKVSWETMLGLFND